MSVAGCRIPCIEACFVFDISKSISRYRRDDRNFNLMKSFVINTFGGVNISADCSRAGVILFARHARILFNLNAHTDEASLETAISQIVLDVKGADVRVGTNTPEALTLLRTAAQDGSLGFSMRSDRSKIRIVLFLTDGRPFIIDEPESPLNDDRCAAEEATFIEGNTLRRSGLYDRIYAIGIDREDKPLRDTLGYIAQPTDLERRLEAFDQGEFDQLRRNLIRDFCDRK